MKIDVTTLDGKKGGSVELDEHVFGQEPRKDILHRMVRYQLAKRQAGTHQVQERGDVSKRNKRIGNQKGGGTARHGNGSVSQFRGGAKAHGPRSRSHAHELPKKVRKMALRHALSAKQGAGELIIVDALSIKKNKTAGLRKTLADMGVTNALIVGRRRDRQGVRSGRPQHSQCRRAAQPGRQRLRHPAPPHAGSVDRRRHSPAGASEMSANAKHYDTVLTPVITEKSTIVAENNQVVFEVPLSANKTEVKARRRAAVQRVGHGREHDHDQGQDEALPRSPGSSFGRQEGHRDAERRRHHRYRHRTIGGL